jgi:hypothetical protein
MVTASSFRSSHCFVAVFGILIFLPVFEQRCLDRTKFESSNAGNVVHLDCALGKESILSASSND